ncbi:hypothetical protein C6Y03_10185 [Bacillus sp. LNXM65]|nr:hypothetical protein C6Y03_10185 [Bacillus sp. LNXM65]
MTKKPALVKVRFFYMLFFKKPRFPSQADDFFACLVVKMIKCSFVRQVPPTYNMVREGSEPFV